ncbi:alpha/beta hydrolase [Micromonospora sp. R77]|uniref:alpha/beta hydrolase family protein n=1 Tax=Micromonospora sp. R77 TaxID=2925836 RepID=UPI001F60C9D4|nr:alpha/beta hydrolase [Micromonospora sp. R77]MCI4066933.1 alpha/beta hydrolase [Micromonospora sp. R77]
MTLRMEVQIGDLGLPATLDVPVGPVRAGVVVLHAAEAGHRSYFCYDHLARLLPGHGIAVLRYDRRPRVDGHDVPLSVQADDAAAAVGLLRRQVGDVPVGLWGVSQGAWAAALTATRHEIAFLVLVSGSGVSPAAQMRYGTAEQLRRHGFGAADVAELDRLRRTVERYLRGETGREPAQAAVDAAAARAWFPLAYLPRELPAQSGTWRDMDFDPVPVFALVNCPVLLFFGETDGWVPIEESVAAWRRAAGTTVEVTVSRLAGCDHLPTRHEGEDLASISPQYADTLLDWLDRRLPRSVDGPPGAGQADVGVSR